ncbi:MAG: FapA family protein [Desulfobacterium sp.]|jgi:uncharacterized protein (DUF342 family)|nr:FapA family protein [Desulfobacterium sp.]
MEDHQNSDSPYPVIGQLALRHGLVTQEAMDLAWKTCCKTGEPFTAFADYLLTNKLLSTLDMQRLMTAARVIEIREKEVKFGTIAVEKGYISIGLLKLALDEQKKEMIHNKRTKRLGEILVEAGMITTDQLKDVLKVQNSLKAADETNPAQTIVPSQEPPLPSKPPTNNQDLTTNISLDRGMNLTIGHQAFEAFISKTDQFDPTITPREIKEIVTQHQIVFGLISETEIDSFIKPKEHPPPPLRVARGIKPQPGTNAVVKYHFKTDRLEIGKIDQRGNIDFRQRGEIPRVAVDAILAEKTPVTQGVDGTNVFGEIIAVAPALDFKIKCGRGAKLSPDGLQVLARIDGEPKLSWDGTISVMDEFVTDRADYETGHIEYPGNIRVKGCIHNGFKVSGENIRAGEIDGGIIHADGDLCVANGITHAVIYSMGAVSAKFIQKSTILCLGDIHTDKEIVESTVETSGACVIKQGTIIASNITAKLGLYSRNVGTERSKPSLLKVGEDIFVLKRIAKLKEEMAWIRQTLAETGEKKSELELKFNESQERCSKLAHMEEASMRAQKETILGIASLNQAGDQGERQRMETQLQILKEKGAKIQESLDQSLDDVEKRAGGIEELSTSIVKQEQRLHDLIQEQENIQKWSRKTPGTPRMDVSQTLMAGTRVMGCHSEITIEKTRQRVTIREVMSATSDKGENPSRWVMEIIPG